MGGVDWRVRWQRPLGGEGAGKGKQGGLRGFIRLRAQHPRAIAPYHDKRSHTHVFFFCHTRMCTQMLKTPGSSLVSSIFFMCLPDRVRDWLTD